MKALAGGPAFPFAATDTSNEQMQAQGMTLRDYLAAKAMQAQVTTDMVPGESCDALVRAAERSGQDPLFRLALNSYEIADAMLMAREHGLRGPTLR